MKGGETGGFCPFDGGLCAHWFDEGLLPKFFKLSSTYFSHLLFSANSVYLKGIKPAPAQILPVLGHGWTNW